MRDVWQGSTCCAWSMSHRRRARLWPGPRQRSTIAVYDLGGGTFDISILKLRDGIFEVQSTNGDTHLGGDDIDNLLLTIALDEIYAEHGVDLRTHPAAVQALRKAAIDAKIALSRSLGPLRHRAAQRRPLSARDSPRRSTC